MSLSQFRSNYERVHSAQKFSLYPCKNTNYRKYSLPFNRKVMMYPEKSHINKCDFLKSHVLMPYGLTVLHYISNCY